MTLQQALTLRAGAFITHSGAPRRILQLEAFVLENQATGYIAGVVTFILEGVADPVDHPHCEPFHETFNASHVLRTAEAIIRRGSVR